MATTDSTVENGTGSEPTFARNLDDPLSEKLADDAMYIGTDAEGSRHFWSVYEQTAFVVDGYDVDAYALAETPLHDLGDWVTHTYSTRGGWTELRVTTGGLGETIARALDWE